MTMQTPGGSVSTSGLRCGRDGKLYKAQALTRQERGQVIRIAHELVCQRGASIRAAQAAMAAAGVRRSTGSIAHDLQAFVCPHCRDEDT